MRTVEIELEEILSIANCAEDYGHGNSVMMDALAEWAGYMVTDEEIEEYARHIESLDGYTEEDYEATHKRLTEWRDRYCYSGRARYYRGEET